MNPLATALLIALFPSLLAAEVFKCMENGKAVYSQYQVSEDCTSMNVTNVTSQNIVSPGAEGFSAADLNVLHGRKQAKEELDRQTSAALDGLSPTERAQLEQEAISKGKILAGMSGRQVIESLGEPTNVEPVPGSQGTQERWYYWVGNRIQHHLVMKNDGVVYYYRTPSNR